MKSAIEFDGVVLNRKAFVSWMGGQETAKRAPLRKLNLARDLTEECCALLWSSSPTSGPHERPLIVLPVNGVTEFFAFVGTYMPDYAPFSAFYRVITLEELDVIIEAAARPLSGFFPQESVGIAIAEAALREGGRKATERTNIAAVRSTLSSVLLASAYNGNRRTSLGAVADHWRLARRILGSDDTATSVQTCLSVVSRYIEALDSESPQTTLAESVRLARLSGGVTAESWRLLVSAFPELSNVFERLRGPREERLKVARSVLQGLAAFEGKLGSEDVDCIGGCVIALIGDGSFLYLPLAIDLGRQSPGTILWFAAWCSVFASTDILSFNGAAGRRIARDLFQPFEIGSPPQCDIAVEELAISADDLRMTNVKALNPAAILVEIFPGVNAVFETERGQSDYQQRREELEDLVEIDRLLDRAREGVARAIYRRERGGPDKATGRERHNRRR